MTTATRRNLLTFNNSTGQSKAAPSAETHTHGPQLSRHHEREYGKNPCHPMNRIINYSTGIMSEALSHKKFRMTMPQCDDGREERQLIGAEKELNAFCI